MAGTTPLRSLTAQHPLPHRFTPLHKAGTHTIPYISPHKGHAHSHTRMIPATAFVQIFPVLPIPFRILFFIFVSHLSAVFLQSFLFLLYKSLPVPLESQLHQKLTPPHKAHTSPHLRLSAIACVHLPLLPPFQSLCFGMQW